MIDVTITPERAQALLDSGARMIIGPYGEPEPMFMFTGPGLLMARLAYDDTELPTTLDWQGPDGQSLWDVAVLRLEHTGGRR